MFDPAYRRVEFPIDWRDTTLCHWIVIALLSMSLAIVATLAVVNRADLQKQVTEAQKDAFFEDLREHMSLQLDKVK